MALKYGGDTVSTVIYGGEYVYFVKYGSTTVYDWKNYVSLGQWNSGNTYDTKIVNNSNTTKYFFSKTYYSTNSASPANPTTTYNNPSSANTNRLSISAGSSDWTGEYTVSSYANRYVSGYFYTCCVWQCLNSLYSVVYGMSAKVDYNAWRSGNSSDD